MKKFLMVTPLQPVGIDEKGRSFDLLRLCDYTPVGNQKLAYHKQTRFPLMHLINGYAEKNEEIRVIAITPKYEYCQTHLQQLRDELAELQAEKGFLCRGVEAVEVDFAGDVATQIEVFHKLLSYVEDDDILYGCLTYGMKPMPIAELMAIQYAYRVLNNVSIGCLVYGEVDYSQPPIGKNEYGKDVYPTRIFDITALIQLDEIVRVLADRKVANPKGIIERILSL